MPSDRFRMDHGAGYTTLLWRQEIVRKHWRKWVWRDAPPGEPHEIQLDDDDGHPCEPAFGLRLPGKFVDVSAKDC